MTILKQRGKGMLIGYKLIKKPSRNWLFGHPCCPIMKGGEFSNGLTTIKSLPFLYGNSTVGISALA